ncbi:unnamed protein product [Clavelina lepadiformis]|uniref:Uncharacterized protein n=1 Tax=Clavelina lepadiformis TaxID=159417 RepID=A0ABP0G285_CLALP
MKFYDETRDFGSNGFEVVPPNNESLNIKGLLAAILADTPGNPSSNGDERRGGFGLQEVPTLLGNCRGNKDKNVVYFILRDNATHEECCRDLTENSRQWGLNRRCY